MENATQSTEMESSTLFDWFDHVKELGLDIWQNGIPGVSLLREQGVPNPITKKAIIIFLEDKEEHPPAGHRRKIMVDIKNPS